MSIWDIHISDIANVLNFIKYLLILVIRKTNDWIMKSKEFDDLRSFWIQDNRLGC